MYTCNMYYISNLFKLVFKFIQREQLKQIHWNLLVDDRPTKVYTILVIIVEMQ